MARDALTSEVHSHAVSSLRFESYLRDSYRPFPRGRVEQIQPAVLHVDRWIAQLMHEIIRAAEARSLHGLKSALEIFPRFEYGLRVGKLPIAPIVIEVRHTGHEDALGLVLAPRVKDVQVIVVLVQPHSHVPRAREGSGGVLEVGEV